MHRDNHLLSSVYPDKFRVDVDKRWTKRQILVTFNDQIDDIPAYPAAQVMTKQGTRLEADLVVSSIILLHDYSTFNIYVRYLPEVAVQTLGSFHHLGRESSLRRVTLKLMLPCRLWISQASLPQAISLTGRRSSR